MVTVMCENFGSTFAPKDRITNGFLCFVCRISVGGPPKHSTDSTDVFFFCMLYIFYEYMLRRFAAWIRFVNDLYAADVDIDILWENIAFSHTQYALRRVCDKNPFTIKLLSGCDSIIHFGVISSSILGNCRSPNKHRWVNPVVNQPTFSAAA